MTGELLAVLAALAALALAGCPKPTGGIDEPDDPKPPPFRTDVAPGEELGEPPAPDAGKFGLAYLERLYPRLRDGWRSFVADCRLRLPPSDPLNEMSLQAVLEFTLSRDGKLVSLALVRKSGDERFDAAAEEVIRDAAPYPEPPSHVVSDDDSVHLAWSFARDRRLAGVATAELTLVEWPVERAIPKLLARESVTGAAMRLVRATEALGDGAAQGEVDKLVGLGREVAAAALLEALHGEDNGVQRLALTTAGRAGVRDVGPRVREIAEKAVDKRLRLDAIAALGSVGSKEAVPFLASILDRSGNGGERTDVTVAAARALAGLGEGDRARASLVSRLQSQNREKRLSALAVLARFPAPEAVADLADILTAGGTSRSARQAACSALGLAAGAGDRANALKAMRKGLDLRDAAVRAACARGLAVAAEAGASPGRITFWRLVKLMKDRDERVRAAAVLAAARTDAKRFAKELYVVRRDKSRAVQSALAEVLAAVPGPVAYRKLADLAKSEEAAVRRKAATSLLARPEKQARELLAGMIGDSDPEVRLQAVMALDGADALSPYLDGDESDLAAAALTRLISVRGRQAMLADVFGRLADAPAASAARVRTAASWLVSCSTTNDP